MGSAFGAMPCLVDRARPLDQQPGQGRRRHPGRACPGPAACMVHALRRRRQDRYYSMALLLHFHPPTVNTSPFTPAVHVRPSLTATPNPSFYH